MYLWRYCSVLTTPALDVTRTPPSGPLDPFPVASGQWSLSSHGTPILAPPTSHEATANPFDRSSFMSVSCGTRRSASPGHIVQHGRTRCQPDQACLPWGTILARSPQTASLASAAHPRQLSTSFQPTAYSKPFRRVWPRVSRGRSWRRRSIDFTAGLACYWSAVAIALNKRSASSDK